MNARALRRTIRAVRGGELIGWWRVGLVLATPIARILFRIRVAGTEHIPLKGPAILSFNHVSALDGPVLAIEVGRRIRRETRFVVASEFFAKFFFGWVLRRYDQISIRRGQGDVDALDEAVETIRRGALAAISPEGAVNGDPGELLRLKRGVARIALPTGAPVVPVGIWGTQSRWPKTGRTWRRPIRPLVAIAFGPPILPSGELTDDGAIEDLRERLRSRMQEQVDAARRMAGDPA
jgi:1-acyl-sn-glycerol-3-phosphate acyltransferase